MYPEDIDSDLDSSIQALRCSFPLERGCCQSVASWETSASDSPAYDCDARCEPVPVRRDGLLSGFECSEFIGLAP